MTHSVPLTRPIPVMIPAPGASSSYVPNAASGDSSRNAVPASIKRSTRSRGSSLPELAACGGAPSTASSSPSTAASSSSPTAAATAKPTGRISIYSALNESTNNELFKAFTTATGVQVDVLPLAAAGDLQTRITAEKNNPQADIFVGGSSEFHDPLGKQGLLVPYISPNAKNLKAELKEANGNWTGWYTGIFGFISNNDRLTKEIGD